MFTIKNTDTSFRYLSRWTVAYKDFANGEDTWKASTVANDFCSYYRAVGKLMLQHFLIALSLPAAFYAILGMFGLVGPDAHTDSWFVFAILAIFNVCGCIALACAIVVPCAALVCVSVEKYQEKFPKKNKPAKQPSVLATWYEGFRHDYCHLIKYED